MEAIFAIRNLRMCRVLMLSQTYNGNFTKLLKQKFIRYENTL